MFMRQLGVLYGFEFWIRWRLESSQEHSSNWKIHFSHQYALKKTTKKNESNVYACKNVSFYVVSIIYYDADADLTIPFCDHYQRYLRDKNIQQNYPRNRPEMIVPSPLLISGILPFENRLCCNYEEITNCLV